MDHPVYTVHPDRFRDVFDVQMDHLAEQGFVIALGFGHFNNSTQIPVDDLWRWARYLVARYGAHPVVWITCQEMNAPEDHGRNRIDVWRAVAEEIARDDGYGHPHSAHQWVLDVGTRPLGGEPWHDWFALQGGHRNSGLTPQARYQGYYDVPAAAARARDRSDVRTGRLRRREHHRRSAQVRLEGDALRQRRLHLRRRRRLGPEMGRADPRWKKYNHAIDSWYAGMALPGAAQMTVLAGFFTSLPWTELTPRFNDPAWCQWRDPERCVLATDGNRLYLAYCYGPTSIGTLKQLDPQATYEARWLDPRDGTYAERFSIRPEQGKWEVPEKPTALDWVLVVKQKR